MANELTSFDFDAATRRPWNNKIFPGNYVAHLNAYRDQGVVALPGAVFFRGVGALVLNPDNDGVLDTDGVLAAGDYDLQILSPDMRQDDKPRKDRPFILPAGAVVYRTSSAAPGVREVTADGSTTITPKGITAPAAVALQANDGATALRDGEVGFFNPVGAFSLFTSLLDASGLAADTPVQITTSKDLKPMLNPSAGACRKSPSAILVEVCYFIPDAAPDADDVHIPYGIEAGQGY